MAVGALASRDLGREMVVAASFLYSDTTAVAVEGRGGCEDVFVYDRANFWWEG